MAANKDRNPFNLECKVREFALPSDIRGLKIDPETGDIWLALSNETIYRYDQQHGLSRVTSWNAIGRRVSSNIRVCFEFLPKQPGHESSRVVVFCRNVPGFYHIRGSDLVALTPDPKATAPLGSYERMLQANEMKPSPSVRQANLAFFWAAQTQNGQLVAQSTTSGIGFVDTTNWNFSPALNQPQDTILSASARDANSCFFLAQMRGDWRYIKSGLLGSYGLYIFDTASNTCASIKIDPSGFPFKDPSWNELNHSIIGTPALKEGVTVDRSTKSSLIITHASQPLAFYNSIDGQWYSHNTITGVSIGDYDYDTNTLAYACPSHPNKLFIAESFFNCALIHSSYQIDIPLLQHSFNDIPADTVFTHAASGATLRLHSFILSTSSNIAATLATLKSTTVPVQIVQNYIAVLYRNETHDPAKIATHPWSDSAAQSLVNATLLTLLLHLTSCNVLSGPYTKPLKEKLDTVEVDEVLLKVFLPAWPYCYDNTHLMDVFACTLRRDPTSLARNATAVYRTVTEKLFASFTGLAINVGNPNHQLSPATPPGRLEYITNVIVEEGHLLEWTSKPPVPPSASAPFTFVFGIDGIEGHVVVRCGWALYSSWSWFRRVLKAKLGEFKTRVITMPSSMSPALLVILLRKFHGISDDGLKKLPASDHITMLALCDELELTTSFALELDYCRASFKNSLKPSSCLKILRQCWELDQKPLVQATLDYISSRWIEVAAQSRADLDLPPDLMSILTRKLASTA